MSCVTPAAAALCPATCMRDVRCLRDGLMAASAQVVLRVILFFCWTVNERLHVHGTTTLVAPSEGARCRDDDDSTYMPHLDEAQSWKPLVRVLMMRTGCWFEAIPLRLCTWR